MFRGNNEGKKVLASKWNEYNQQIHYKKLKNMRGLVDTSCPQTYGALRHKPKKEQILEDRFTEIERENRILLEKMSQIVNSRSQRSASNNRRKSLNAEARQRQNMQIVMENQALLKRLQEKQPSYSVYKWEEERRSTEKRIKNICEFPYTLGFEEFPKKPAEMRTRNSSRSRKIIRIPDPASKNPRKLSPITRKKQVTVFKKGMSVGNKHFIVEIQKKDNHITILAFDIESPESFCLEMSFEEALELMNGEENYPVLASMLGIEDGDLILLDSRLEEVQSEPHRSRVKGENVVVESGNMFEPSGYSFRESEKKDLNLTQPVYVANNEESDEEKRQNYSSDEGALSEGARDEREEAEERESERRIGEDSGKYSVNSLRKEGNEKEDSSASGEIDLGRGVEDEEKYEEEEEGFEEESSEKDLEDVKSGEESENRAVVKEIERDEVIGKDGEGREGEDYASSVKSLEKSSEKEVGKDEKSEGSLSEKNLEKESEKNESVENFEKVSESGSEKNKSIDLGHYSQGLESKEESKKDLIRSEKESEGNKSVKSLEKESLNNKSSESIKKEDNESVKNLDKSQSSKSLENNSEKLEKLEQESQQGDNPDEKSADLENLEPESQQDDNPDENSEELESIKDKSLEKSNHSDKSLKNLSEKAESHKTLENQSNPSKKSLPKHSEKAESHKSLKNHSNSSEKSLEKHSENPETPKNLELAHEHPNPPIESFQLPLKTTSPHHSEKNLPKSDSQEFSEIPNRSVSASPNLNKSSPKKSVKELISELDTKFEVDLGFLPHLGNPEHLPDGFLQVDNPVIEEAPSEIEGENRNEDLKHADESKEENLKESNEKEIEDRLKGESKEESLKENNEKKIEERLKGESEEESLKENNEESLKGVDEEDFEAGLEGEGIEKDLEGKNEEEFDAGLKEGEEVESEEGEVFEKYEKKIEFDDEEEKSREEGAIEGIEGRMDQDEGEKKENTGEAHAAEYEKNAEKHEEKNKINEYDQNSEENHIEKISGIDEIVENNEKTEEVPSKLEHSPEKTPNPIKEENKG